MLFEHGLFTTESWVSEEKQHFINMEVAAARAAEHHGNSMYSEEEPGRRPPSHFQPSKVDAGRCFDPHFFSTK